MRKYCYYIFFELAHKDGKTYVNSRTWVWLIFFPLLLCGVFLVKIVSGVITGLIEFIFEAFNMGEPTKYRKEDIDSYKSRSLKSKLNMIKNLIEL